MKSARQAWEEGGHFQSKAAGRPGSKRQQIADKSVFLKSEAPYDAPYVAHCCRTCIGFMANTVRRVSRRWAAGTVGGSPR